MKRIILIISIVIYCYATLMWGIIHTQQKLRDDIITQKWEWGRNEFLCSYWYELYNPSKTMEWYKKNINQPLIYLSGDKAATPNYFMHHKLNIQRETPADSVFIWSIYLNSYDLTDYNIQRVNPELSWQNIFFLTRQ